MFCLDELDSEIPSQPHKVLPPGLQQDSGDSGRINCGVICAPGICLVFGGTGGTCSHQDNMEALII